MRYRWLVFLSIGIFLITGCNDSSTDSGGGALESARDSNEQMTATPSDTFDDGIPSDNADENANNVTNLEDLLVYTANENLYAWDFSKSENPQEIAANVDMDQIYTDTEQKHLIFGAIPSSNFGIYQLELDNFDTSLIVEVPFSRFVPNWSLSGWSPDQKWIILNISNVGMPLGFIKADGSSEFVQLANTWQPTYWTKDNQILLVESQMNSRFDQSPSPIKKIIKIDPETDTRTDLTAEIDLEFINSAEDYGQHQQRLMDALAELEIELTFSLGNSSSNSDEPETVINIKRPDNSNDQPQYCNTWEIAEWELNSATDTRFTTEPAQIIHTFTDTALLADFTRLEDGSFLFIQASYPDCTYGTPEGKLIHMQPDGSYTTLSENIVSTSDSSVFRGFLDDNRFIIAPNEQQVVWIHQGEYGLPEQKALYVSDLVTGETTQLLVDGEPMTSIVSLRWIEN